MRRLHVDTRVAHHDALIAPDTRLVDDHIYEGRVGLQGHTLALAADGHEVYVGEEFAYEFCGALLKLVRRYGHLNAAAGECLNYLRNAIVWAGMDVDVVDVVVEEILPRRLHVFGCAQILGQGPLHEAQDAVPHEMAILFVGVLLQAAQREHVVGADGKVAYGVEQRAVEVKYYETCLHRCRCVFCISCSLWRPL